MQYCFALAYLRALELGVTVKTASGASFALDAALKKRSPLIFPRLIALKDILAKFASVTDISQANMDELFDDVNRVLWELHLKHVSPRGPAFPSQEDRLSVILGGKPSVGIA